MLRYQLEKKPYISHCAVQNNVGCMFIKEVLSTYAQNITVDDIKSFFIRIEAATLKRYYSPKK